MKNLTFIAMMAISLSWVACSTDDNEEPKLLSFNFTKEEITSDAIELEWDAIPGADSYKLHLSNQNGSDIKDAPSTMETFEFSKLFAGTEYTFTIKAFDASDNMLCELTKKHTTVSLPAGLIGKWQNGTNPEINEVFLLNTTGTGTYTYGTSSVTLRWKTSNNNIILDINYPTGAKIETYTYETSSLGIKIGQNSYVNVN